MELKETKELIKMLGELAYTAGAVMKDGKVNAADLTHLPTLIMKYPTFAEGVKDIDVALEEVKNLDQAEVIEIIACLYEAVNRFAEGKRA